MGDTSATTDFINTVAIFTIRWHLTIQQGKSMDDGIG
jgi:hypothetical protein